MPCFKKPGHLSTLGYRNCARFSSGKAAVEFIKYNPARIIIVDTEVEDLSMTEFVAALREVRQVNFCTSWSSPPTVPKDSCSASSPRAVPGWSFVPTRSRPLEKHMLQSEKMLPTHDADRDTVDQASTMIAQGRFEDAIGDLTLVVSQEDEQASQFFFRGCQHLVEKKWSDAIRAFNQSLERNQTFIKAYEGSAKAFGKNDIDRYRYCLQKAAEEYAKLNNFSKVKKIFVEIVKYDVNAPNPYNTLGIRLRQEKQYKEAIQAYFQAIELEPKDENIHYNMAKAYYCDAQPAKALECIKLALSLSPEHLEALKMYRMLTGISWEDNADAPFQPPRWT